MSDTTQPLAVESTAREPLSACAICDRPAADALLAKAAALESVVASRIAATRPGWERSAGVCPVCVQEALQIALRSDAPFSLESERAGVDPDALPEYHDDLFVLSTPMRLQTWPHVTGRGVTVAFVDAGFFDHPDLVEPTDRIAVRVDARYDPPRRVERNDMSDPSCFHGLMTTAVAAGNGARSSGHYRGLAPEARLVLVRVGDPETGAIGEREIARGLDWLVRHAAELDVRVVNVSLGGDRPSPSDANPVDPLVEALVEAGVTVVAASGNEGSREIVPPASAPSSITVGGIDDANSIEHAAAEGWNSNFGVTFDGVRKPEVVAPSVWIAAPLILGTELHDRAEAIFELLGARDDEVHEVLDRVRERLALDETAFGEGPAGVRAAAARLRREMKLLSAAYQHVEGTSFAAPIVTGLVAQMLEVNAALTPSEIKKILMRSAFMLPQVPREMQGAGVVNPVLALDVASRAARGDAEDTGWWPREEGDRYLFELRADAERVDLIGDFNGWLPGATPLDEVKHKLWRATIARPEPGIYRYKFLIDGERWIDDSENPHREWDGYGGLNAVLRVGPRPVVEEPRTEADEP
jgi:serine protease AprX